MNLVIENTTDFSIDDWLEELMSFSSPVIDSTLNVESPMAIDDTDIRAEINGM